jgi:hypothetical protein
LAASRLTNCRPKLSLGAATCSSERELAADESGRDDDLPHAEVAGRHHVVLDLVQSLDDVRTLLAG